jgi:hypothetical protein
MPPNTSNLSIKLTRFQTHVTSHMEQLVHPSSFQTVQVIFFISATYIYVYIFYRCPMDVKFTTLK